MYACQATLWCPAATKSFKNSAMNATSPSDTAAMACKPAPPPPPNGVDRGATAPTQARARAPHTHTTRRGRWGHHHKEGQAGVRTPAAAAQNNARHLEPSVPQKARAHKGASRP